ncbi:murein hydrolase activator EnvC family protein [Enterococcus sp. LJL98]
MFNIKKITVLTLSSLLMFSPVITIQADEYDEKIQKQTEKISNLEGEQLAAQKALNAIEAQVHQIEADIDAILTKKAQEEERLNELHAEIADLQVAIAKRNEQLEEQARNVQVNQSHNNLIEAVLTAESLNEAFSRALAVTTIVNANNEIIVKQKEDQAKLEEVSKEAQERLTVIEEQSQLLKEQQEALFSARLDQEVAINDLQSMIATEKKQKAKFESQKAEAIRKREEELKALAAQKAKEAAARKAAAEQEAREEAKAFEQALENEQAQNNSNNQSAGGATNTGTPSVDTPTVETPSVPSSSGWGRPVSSLSVSSTFGWRSNPWGGGASDLHDGIDLVGSAGTSIFASKAGTVLTAGYDPSAGNHVIIDHGDGYYSYYLHLSSFAVSVGQSVSQGTIVGGMGTTGNSTGVHLHFGIATGIWSGFVDPAPLIGL